MTNTISTRRPLFGLSRLRAAYLRYLLRNAELDIEHAERQVKAYRYEAQRIRVELSLLESL